MSKHRTLSRKSKYYLPKETFLTVVHYCKQYPLWADEIRHTADTRGALTYDKDRVQTSNDYDPTSSTAMRLAEVSAKKEAVDQVAVDVGGVIAEWLILGVCYGVPFFQLRDKGIPCGKDMYYDRRRKFYFEMAKKI